MICRRGREQRWWSVSEVQLVAQIQGAECPAGDVYVTATVTI
jgi:hypothetical protein